MTRSSSFNTVNIDLNAPARHNMFLYQPPVLQWVPIYVKSKLSATSHPLEMSSVPVIKNNKDWLTGIQSAFWFLQSLGLDKDTSIITYHIPFSVTTKIKQLWHPVMKKCSTWVDGGDAMNRRLCLSPSAICVPRWFLNLQLFVFMVFSANVYDVTVFVFVQQKQQKCLANYLNYRAITYLGTIGKSFLGAQIKQTEKKRKWT